MMTATAFRLATAEALNRIDPDILIRGETLEISPLYTYIESYCLEHQLPNAAIALPLVRWVMSCDANRRSTKFGNPATHLAYYRHAMAVCRMLIDLHIPVSHSEEDILLTAALCHVLPENIRFEDFPRELEEVYHLPRPVCQILRLIVREDDQSEAEQRRFFQRIQDDKLALLIKLADRGNLAEQLYSISSWSARNYIHETRHYFFPMCIHAKENYPELLGPVSVMMEKMRCLIEIAEILLSRYESRENELVQEIMNLRDENATLRSMIRTMEEGRRN